MKEKKTRIKFYYCDECNLQAEPSCVEGEDIMYICPNCREAGPELSMVSMNVAIKKRFYKVKIEETLSRIVEVEASSEQNAMDQVGGMYQTGSIVLDKREHFEDFDYTILREER